MFTNPFTFFPSVLPAWTNAYTDYIELFSFYNNLYIKSYYDALKEFDSTNSSLYEAWLHHTDKELEQELRSEEFISLLSRFVTSFVELRSVFKDNNFPVEYFDKIFDNFVRNLMVFSSVPKEFDNTPFDVVSTSGKTRLLHYRTDRIDDVKENVNKKNTSPLLIVYAPINRYNIMDLTPEKSVIRELLSSGLDVYLIDWGYPSWDDDNLSLDNYFKYIYDAVQMIKDNSKVEKISILGYCWGGIIALIYAVLYKENVEKLALMAVPIDASKDHSMLATWAKSIDTDKIIKEFRHMDGQILDLGFIMRNPPKYTFDKYLKFYQKLGDKKFVDTFIAVEKWLYDTPSIPGKLCSQIINDCYKNNLLIQNMMKLENKEINLQSLDVPILLITAHNDDLVSPESTLAIREHIQGKNVESMQISGGHVGLCISAKAHKNLWPGVSQWFLTK
jgi:polyhydroxyalkanoate synthase subunit PhaC